MGDSENPDGQVDGDVSVDAPGMRLHGRRACRDDVDVPAGGGCLYGEQLFDEGSVTAIADTRMICSGGT